MIQTAPDTQTQILTKPQVAKMLQVNERTITEWVRTRDFPRLRLGGGTIRFDQEAVLRWAMARAEGASE